jgi:hypothetical protein
MIEGLAKNSKKTLPTLLKIGSRHRLSICYVIDRQVPTPITGGSNVSDEVPAPTPRSSTFAFLKIARIFKIFKLFFFASAAAVTTTILAVAQGFFVS